MERDCENCQFFYECDNMGWYREEKCLMERNAVIRTDILTPWSEESAYKYYRSALDIGLATKESLKAKYDDAESHRTEWENHGDDPYKMRDYESFCNAQNALVKLIMELEEE